jgi:hypothetical protein
MEKKREFYPMITKTVKTILSLATPQEKQQILFILRYYPLRNTMPEKEICSFDKAAQELLKELDRQYERWEKGGVK